MTWFRAFIAFNGFSFLHFTLALIHTISHPIPQSFHHLISSPMWRGRGDGAKVQLTNPRTNERTDRQYGCCSLNPHPQPPTPLPIPPSCHHFIVWFHHRSGEGVGGGCEGAANELSSSQTDRRTDSLKDAYRRSQTHWQTKRSKYGFCYTKKSPKKEEKKLFARNRAEPGWRMM